MEWGLWVLIQLGLCALMGPIRGHKKKRKTEKMVEQKALASGSSEKGSADWWDEFSRRIAGM
ncbi:unnamed protein product [Ilex paraguariensis]|uniref:Uncharacterized protein n=1 Tax=Ilex paraguariensis TaxID=185542 RepID=A0ABC8RC11_9AQUA